jgi:tripartite-type tricarboxylate transporter receptor subunit TctC
MSAMPLPPITAWQRGGPDGYQFVLRFTAHHAFHPTLHKTPVYNPRTDFAPVALGVEQPFLLVTSNLQEFAAYAKANQATL